MAQSSQAQSVAPSAETEPVTWEEAIRVGSRSVRLAERLLARIWLMPFPLPVEEQPEPPEPEQRADQEFTEITILGVYWGKALPNQAPHSVFVALPEIAAAGIDGVVTASTTCVDSE
eukprot:6470859-Amphidinium_carterae.1